MLATACGRKAGGAPAVRRVDLSPAESCRGDVPVQIRIVRATIRKDLYRFKSVRQLHRSVRRQQGHKVAVKRNAGHFSPVTAIWDARILNIRSAVPRLLIRHAKRMTNQRMPLCASAIEKANSRRVFGRWHDACRPTFTNAAQSERRSRPWSMQQDSFRTCFHWNSSNWRAFQSTRPNGAAGRTQRYTRRPAACSLHVEDLFDGLSRRPKNRGPFQRVPVMAKATCERLG